MGEPAIESTKLGQTLVEILDVLASSPRGAMVRLAKWPGEDEVIVDVLIYKDPNREFEPRDRGGMVRLRTDDARDVRLRKLNLLADAVRKTVNGNETEET